MKWRKSTYSDGGAGDTCVEIATLPAHIAIRDSKAPARATLTFPAPAFTALVDHLKEHPSAILAGSDGVGAHS
ncbi:DUF397 domain-containing protein [Streptomyces sp. CA-249302]|uniref:DUF397 domain-containing protein n=1 Tax=Streptomyces sp. CA-249302 TaxID=3240058 RepID=UPI003D93349A